MTEMSERTGLTRQWVSKLAAQGHVPDAHRKSSGRWEFRRTQELEDWIKREGRINGIKIRKRFLHRDEAAVDELGKKIARVRVSPNAKADQKRLRELYAELERRKAAIKDRLSTREIAKLVGRSRRWVAIKAPSIPGFCQFGKRFMFAKSTLLSQWIQRQKRLRQIDRLRLRGAMKFPRSADYELLWATIRYEKLLIQVFAQYPPSVWPKDSLAECGKNLTKVAATIRRISDEIAASPRDAT